MKEKNKIDYRKSSQELVNRIQTVPNDELFNQSTAAKQLKISRNTFTKYFLSERVLKTLNIEYKTVGKNKVYDGKSLNKITNYYKKHPNYFT